MDQANDHETGDVTVVVATRNRRDQLLATLPRHAARVILVDNGSDDGGPEAVEAAFPHVTVVRLGANLGAAARNVGAGLADTPFVAFADDDSFWMPGSLRRAAGMLHDDGRLALLAARVLVGPDERLDPISAQMAAAPIGAPASGPGPYVLGFLACSAIVRRDAFLAAGGFSARLRIYGEEALLAMDLAAAGWTLAYAPDLVVRHLPQPSGRDPRARRRLEARNRLLTAVLRRPRAEISKAASEAWQTDRGAITDALRQLPWALRHRRPLPATVEADLARLAS